MNILSKWLTRSSTVIGLCWCALLLNSSVPGLVESKVLPVVDSYRLQVKESPYDKTKSIISGFIKLKRDSCSFTGLEWRMLDTNSRSGLRSKRDLRVSVEFIDSDKQMSSDDPSLFVVDDWVVNIGFNSVLFRRGNAYVLYSCHPFWETKVPVEIRLEGDNE